MAARFQARAGVDLGGTKIQAVVVDGRNRVRGTSRLATPQSGGPAAVVAAIAAAVLSAAETAGIEGVGPDGAASSGRPSSARGGGLVGVGVGSPGEVYSDTGVVAQARNLPGWEGSFPLGPELSRALGGVPVALGNDVDVAVRGEFELGAGRPFRTVLGVWWGTGVGGGLILDGNPWTGRGAAAEIGHVVVKIGGRRCPCGRRGCMEAYAGRAGMEARARKLVGEGRQTKLFKIMEERGRDRLTSGIWARALKQEDKLAREILDEAMEALGAGVASVCNVIDPEAVILGGGLGVRFGEDCAGRLAKEMLPHLFADDRPPAVHVAALGDLGGAIGAALLAR
ncbi:MAG: glucokinase [Solirubrobacteraceae bacterium]|nr:glucokinase [Solirubrobacteraceae bacterium]